MYTFNNNGPSLLQDYSHFCNSIKTVQFLPFLPGLVSESLLSSNQSFFRNKLTVLSLAKKLARHLSIKSFVAYFSYVLRFRFLCSGQFHKTILITRASGIRNHKESLDDYRFADIGLELTKAERFAKVIYYIHGNCQAYKSKYTKNAIIATNIDKLSESGAALFCLYKRLIGTNTVHVAYYSLCKMFLKSRLLSIILSEDDKCFFWDYNYQHFPLYIACANKKILTVGSIHGYHNVNHMPWVSESILNRTGLINNNKVLFYDYHRAAVDMITYLDNILLEIDTKRPNGSNLLKTNKALDLEHTDIVVIQENQASQHNLLHWIASNKLPSMTLFAKLRPDRSQSESFQNTLATILGSSVHYVSDIPHDKQIIIIGQCSTYLLDLAISGHNVFVFEDIANTDFFTNPARPYWNYSEEQIYLSQTLGFGNIFSVDRFSSLESAKPLVGQKNVLLNHYALKTYKKSSLIDLLLYR